MVCSIFGMTGRDRQSFRRSSVTLWFFEHRQPFHTTVVFPELALVNFISFLPIIMLQCLPSELAAACWHSRHEVGACWD